MGKTAKKVKWSLGAEEPEDLQDFMSNEDIEEKYGRPPKGNYTLAVRRIKVREIGSGDNAGEDRLNLMLVIKEPKGSDKAKFNGYLVWDGMNVTQQGAPYIKRFLKALGLEWKDFVDRSKQDDEDPPQLLQIGKVKFGDGATGDDPTVRAMINFKPNRQSGDMEPNIARYLPLDDGKPTGEFAEDDDEDEDEATFGADSADDEDDDEDEAEADESDDEEDDEDSEDDDDEDEEDDDDEDDEEDDDDDEPEDDEDEDAEAELREELNGLKVAALQKRAQRVVKKSKGVLDADDVPAKKAALVDWLVEVELTDPPF